MSSVNFLPSSFFDAARRMRRRVWELAIVGTALVAVVGGFYLLSDQADAAREDLAAMTKVGAVIKIDLREKKQLEERKETLVDRLSAFYEMASPVSATQILAALSQIQDDSIGLTELVIDGKTPTPSVKVDSKAEGKAKKSSARRGAAPPPKHTDGLRILITGFGPDDATVTGYVGRISRHPLFKDVKLEFSKSIEMGELLGRGFTISALVPLDCEYRSPVSKESVTDAN